MKSSTKIASKSKNTAYEVVSVKTQKSRLQKLCPLRLYKDSIDTATCTEYDSTVKKYIKIPLGNKIYFDFGTKIVGRLTANIRSISDGKAIFHAFSHPAAERALVFSAHNYDNPEWPRSKSLVGGPLTIKYKRGTTEIEFNRTQAFRYILIEASCEIEITQIGVIESKFPTSISGYFECSDSDVNKAWEMGVRTTNLCIQPAVDSSHPLKGIYSDYVLWDGPRTDREIWVADVRPAALTMYYTMGVPEVAKNSLALLGERRFSNGLIPGSASSRQQYIEYAFWWIISLWDYYLYTGDKKFLIEMYDIFKMQIKWFESNKNSKGFIPVDRLWSYTVSRGAENGMSIVLQKYAFECAAKIEKVFGNDSKADYLEKWSDVCKQYVLKNYFSEKTGIVNDLPGVFSHISEDTNVLAVLFNVLDNKQSIKSLHNICSRLWTRFGSVLRDPKFTEQEILPEHRRDAAWMHNDAIWPYMNAYEVGAWFKVGNIDKGLDLLKRYTSACRSHGTDTIWECIPSQGGLNVSPDERFAGSICHAWGGTGSYYLMKYILGVQIQSPGCRSIKITPNLGSLEWAQGSVVTPEGNIDVEVTKTDDGVNVNVRDCPKTIKVLNN